MNAGPREGVLKLNGVVHRRTRASNVPMGDDPAALPRRCCLPYLHAHILDAHDRTSGSAATPVMPARHSRVADRPRAPSCRIFPSFLRRYFHSTHPRTIPQEPPVSTRDLPDLPVVNPQRTYLQSHPRKPEAASTLYIQRFTTKHADETESHTVTGVHVVLAPGQPNGLWEALHVDRNQLLDPLRPRVATRELLVCCDTLEVRGAFSLLEAAVSVFVRRVIWATDDAAIDTSPLRWSGTKAQGASGSTPGASGAAGRHAGSIRLFAEEMAGAAAPGPRLLAQGGSGQDAGAGLDGSDGASPWSSSSEKFALVDKELWGTVTSKADVSFSPPAVYIDFGWYWGAKLKGGKRGQDAFPGNGTDAVAPGAPGGGGNGGALTTNVAEAARLFRNGGGQPGARERDYRGGSVGSPSPAAKYALKLRHDSAGYDLEKTAEHTSTARKDAPAPRSHAAAGATPQPTVSRRAQRVAPPTWPAGGAGVRPQRR